MVSSSYDVVLYAGILGLASLDRYGLTTLLENNGMKQRLEQIPALRDALRAYQRAEYGACLTQLHPDTGLRASMVLDVHLSSHVPTLIGMIRDRCIVQYCLPYLSVNLESMARRLCFTSGNGGTGTNGVEELEEAVEQLILRGRMKARIDGQRGTLTTEFDEKHLNAIQTNKLTRKVDRMGDRFVQNVQSKLLRMNCREMGLTVGVQPREFDAPNARQGRGGGSSAAGGDYVEYDEYHSDDGMEGEGSAGEDMDADAEVASAGDRFVQNVQSKLLRMNCREMGLTVGVQPREFDAQNARSRSGGSSAAGGDFVEYGDDYNSDDMGMEGSAGEDMDADAEVASAIAQGMNVSPEHS
eukprot:CAMPEP_0171322592 /NCGR_PEP_ID=MMETSP0816-20121228/115058_1 /TAXON_ID=420281 /ORGANISM="Proboscia inermis, Strain CCAP1064/1" /LENGTH=354 /DNA_ID=CAMNT_0011821113 /DNA_START=47 /DNA_END=1111 /DNA_ORIENTATION=-